MRDSVYMTERWAATYNPANFIPVDQDEEKPRLFWRDWDVDLILSFHPGIILNHLDHFKNNTNMEPKFISLCSEKYWQVIKKWDGHLSLHLSLHDTDHCALVVENNAIIYTRSGGCALPDRCFGRLASEDRITPRNLYEN